jgi:uncharacterized Fe-S cluster-containing radical SAM superfamily protein
MVPLIDTDRLSARLRARAIDLERRRLLITRFVGTEQAKDLTEPPNCGGFGRVRHFRRATQPGWPSNPLPIDPACSALDLPDTDLLRAQVFQNAVCNWRCWYCFVPFGLLSGNLSYAEWLGAGDLMDLYLQQQDPPAVIDLTGGQPDLTPEWIPWMMAEIRARGLDHSVYLWSDDNLSNDYFWRYLSDAEVDSIVGYPNYGRVCCFKGFDAASFSFNTRAEPELFERQFQLMERLLQTGIDLYAYTTFTCATPNGVSDQMARFVDRLQQLDENLPLRTVPLEIKAFTPVTARLDADREASMTYQWLAIEAWQQELSDRFDSAARSLAITEVPLHH